MRASTVALLVVVGFALALVALAARNAPCAALHQTQTIEAIMRRKGLLEGDVRTALDTTRRAYDVFRRGERVDGLTRICAQHDSCRPEAIIGTAADGAFVLAFAGSHSRQHWLTNAMALLHPASAVLPKFPPNVTLHTGALLAYSAVRAKLLAALPESLDAPIIVTGHSLGAMLAQIAALDLVLQGYTGVRNITFASPPVGNAAFATFYDEMVTDPQHFIVYGDPLHHLDMWTSRREVYQDVSSLIFLDPGESFLTACPRVQL